MAYKKKQTVRRCLPSKIVLSFSREFRFGLWCLTPLSTLFQLYRGVDVLLLEETGIPGENYRPDASH
jgi:hypothetical protein